MESSVTSPTRYKLDPRVAEVFIAQIDLFCAPPHSMDEKRASTRRDEWLASLNDEQRIYATIIATELARVCETPRRAA